MQNASRFWAPWGPPGGPFWGPGGVILVVLLGPLRGTFRMRINLLSKVEDRYYIHSVGAICSSEFQLGLAGQSSNAHTFLSLPFTLSSPSLLSC